MATQRLTSSYHLSNPTKSLKSSVSATSPWLSVNYGTRDDINISPSAYTSLPHTPNESLGRENQLHEPLLEMKANESLVQRAPDKPTSHKYSGDSIKRDNGTFRKRARKWRKGMGLPRTRPPRRKTVHDAFIDSSKNTPQYVKHCTPDNLLARARLRILRGVESWIVKLFSLLILIAVVAFNIIKLVLGPTNLMFGVEEIFQILDLIFATIFCVEVGLRLVGQGKVYFRRCFEIFDLSVVVISAVLTAIYVIIVEETVYNTDHVPKLTISCLRFIILGRLLRIFFWIRVADEQRSIITYVRSKVSQNKRRYIEDGFDLDLTYVTDRVIAMSFPSSGSRSLYRNSIQEVGRFLDKMHFGHYRVYNLCSEREYDTSYFHNQVQRILIDDHNVPKFTDLVDFCEDALTWMEANEKNVIVVHCKGGKGRTGMMICAWLVRSGLFEEARESLEYFTIRRTDTRRGNKSQGVDTPSQSRYVQYYERLISTMGRNLPPPVSLRLNLVTLHGMAGMDTKGDGTSWQFEVYLAADIVFESSLDSPNDYILSITHDSVADKVDILFSPAKPVILIDDVKFKFSSADRSIPNGNDKCHFYFWFHTTFIQDNKLYLERDDLDNLHKSKLQCHYSPQFAVELAFETFDDVSGAFSFIETPHDQRQLVEVPCSDPQDNA